MTNKTGVAAIAIISIIALILSGVAIYLVAITNSEINGLAKNVGELSDNTKNISNSLSSIISEVNSLKTPYKFPLTLVDASGRTVVIEHEPKRIVSMAPSITEMLFALGLGDKVVGVTRYCDYPHQVVKLVKEGKIQVIGGFTDPSIEKIVSLNPDLVIGCEIHEKFVPLLDSLGLNVMIVGSKSVDNVYKSIYLIGKACGVEDKALSLVDNIKDHIRDTWFKVRNASKPSVLVIAWLNPLWVTGRDTYIDDLISLAGGVNAYSGNGWKSIDTETFLKLDPDIIIITSHAAPGQSPDKILNYLKQSIPGWENVSAVADNKVYFLSGDAEEAFVRPGPRIALAIEILAKIIHPEIFGESGHIVSEAGLIVEPIQQTMLQNKALIIEKIVVVG